ncbi:MAG TPA: sulfite exporter TauE/SafE family protein [Burkholderiales bacterium]
MPETTFVAVFLAGLLGGGHCAAMCGGIIGALSAQDRSALRLQLAYSSGRIASYSAAGAVAGAIGSVVLAEHILPLQIGLYVLANVVLVMIGLYLAGWKSLLVRMELPGRWLWQKISPLTRRFVPAVTVPRAFALGGIWGWLPCGLTYSVLAISLLGGSGLTGAGLMAAFGLGTLPNVLAAGLLLRRFRPWSRNRLGGWVAGAMVMAFGGAGLVHAAWLGDQLRRGVLCLP